jgi:hypothetical protein
MNITSTFPGCARSSGKPTIQFTQLFSLTLPLFGEKEHWILLSEYPLIGFSLGIIPSANSSDSVPTHQGIRPRFHYFCFSHSSFLGENEHWNHLSE